MRFEVITFPHVVRVTLYERYLLIFVLSAKNTVSSLEKMFYLQIMLQSFDIRSSTTADGPRDAMCQSKSCQVHVA